MTVIFLYAWARFVPIGYDLPVGLAISDLAAGLAAGSSLISLILVFWLPQKHHEFIAFAVYALTVAVVSSIIATSGGTSSPFVGSWFIIAVFAGYFGLAATTGMTLLLLAQVFLADFGQSINLQSAVSQIFFGMIPIILGSVLWHRQPDKKKDNTLVELAGKLSTVEGKSDVVINTIDDGVIAINKSGVIDLINPAAQRLVGWSGGDALGLDWRSVLKLVNAEGREVAENDNPITQALTTNLSTHTDKLWLETGSGKKRLVYIVGSPVGSSEDGIIVVFRDITKEKAEEREQAEFISTASHEMRTPVASIEGYLGLALNPSTANIDESAREFLTKAHASAQHLGKLFQDLLDISKSEDGRLKNDPKIIDVSATTGEIFEGLSHLAGEKQLRYIFKPNPSLETETSERRMQPVFYADVDPSHFREVISNLIENAIKYTPSGDVVVDVTGDDKVVTISVQDTGIGIPTEDLSHLFQKFYRVDNTDTREINGTGLGLYLSRRLAETMGGNLRVESQYQKGSTFFLDIPRISHEDAMQRLDEQATAQQAQIIHQNWSAVPQQPAQMTTESQAPPAQINYSPVQQVHNPITIQPPQEVITQPVVASPGSATPNTSGMNIADIETNFATQPNPQEQQAAHAGVLPQQPSATTTPVTQTMSPDQPQAIPQNPATSIPQGGMPTSPTQTGQPHNQTNPPTG